MDLTMPPKLQKLYLNAGQMKAGTTYLYKLLQSHPDIFFSPEKEIHYLSEMHGPFRILSDSVRLRKGKSFMEIADRLDRPIARYREIAQWVADYLRPLDAEGWYQDMFRGHRPNQWLADFSNLTCTMPVGGLHKISDIADDIRVTYCIRDAVTRAFSHAKFHLRFTGEGHDLAALPEKRLRELLLSDNIYPQSRSGEHIGALHAVFGDERLRIIRCESLWENPRPVVDALCNCLEIPPIPGALPCEAVNVGPNSNTTERLMQVFEDIFGELRDQHEALLARHQNIVIG